MSRELAEHVADQLDAPVDLRRFFGGWALVLGGVQFAFVMDTLYLATDDATRPQLIEAGSVPFAYTAKGRVVTVERYYSAPPGALDDRTQLRRLAGLALSAAVGPRRGRRTARG